MTSILIQLVWDRANHRCEYCQFPQAAYEARFQIDHIIARQHDGETLPDNLALSCFRCNTFKGPNLAGLDKVSAELAPLFHPRKHRWIEHFQWQGAHLLGLTAIGRVTISVLSINDARAVAVRKALIEEGIFPPDTR